MTPSPEKLFNDASNSFKELFSGYEHLKNDFGTKKTKANKITVSFSDHNKGPLHTELDKIFKVLQDNLPVLEKLFSGSEANPSLANLYTISKSENTGLHSENEVYRERIVELEGQLEKYAVCSNVEVMFQGWQTTIKEETERCVKDSIKEVMGKDLKKSFADVVRESQSKGIGDDLKKIVKESQDSIKVQTEQWFENSLTSALQENQAEMIQHTNSRHDADLFEKEKRSINVAIRNIPESEKAEINDRINDDMEIFAEIANISKDRIQKCYRAGHPLGTGANSKSKSDRTGPRPLIVVLDTPEFARTLHRYGNGNKVVHDGTEYWINPDLTRSERVANYKARQFLRKRRTERNAESGNSQQSTN